MAAKNKTCETHPKEPAFATLTVHGVYQDVQTDLCLTCVDDFIEREGDRPANPSTPKWTLTTVGVDQ